MGNYTGAVCKLCRREKQKLLLKGEKCFSQKCPIEKGKKYAPGQHGKKPVKLSEYSRRLREKQKLKHIAGIRERQLKRYFELAKTQKGLVGENLLKLIERRLDNVVYLLGWASSRKFARQLVSHRHVIVNNKKVNVSSYLVKIGDKIKLDNSLKDNVYILKNLENASRIPSWIKYYPEEFMAEIISLPSREESSSPVNETLIVEFYSK
jgi:small subunit ribosomal protein S4